jgi:hypothetical protein
MSREHLQRASRRLRTAAEAATDEGAADRLREQADEFATHADRDRGPDHGRLARHERILNEIAADENDAVSSAIEDALEEIRAFRATVDGV